MCFVFTFLASNNALNWLVLAWCALYAQSGAKSGSTTANTPFGRLLLMPITTSNTGMLKLQPLMKNIKQSDVKKMSDRWCVSLTFDVRWSFYNVGKLLLFRFVFIFCFVLFLHLFMDLLSLFWHCSQRVRFEGQSEEWSAGWGGDPEFPMAMNVTVCTPHSNLTLTFAVHLLLTWALLALFIEQCANCRTLTQRPIW